MSCSCIIFDVYAGDYASVVPLASQWDLPQVQSFDVSLCSDLDLLFLAVPHTKAMGIVEDVCRACPGLKLIDLSADFRLSDVSVYESMYSVKHSSPNRLSQFVYGLPEMYRHELVTAQYCANPGVMQRLLF